MKFKSTLFLLIFIILVQGCESKETISDETFTKEKETVKKEVKANTKDDADKIVFNLKTYDDKKFNITINNQKWNFEGYENKVILLDFFATWCPPCKRSIPHLNTIRTQFKDKVEILGLDIGNRDGTINSKEKLAKFIKDYNIKYPVTRGNVNNQIFSGLSSLNPMGSIPFMILFNQDGQFVKPYVGMVPEQQLHNDISSLLKK
ncbi:MAG: TlpA family protein disulfide reductase [Campylobacteraceae bacterium]|jgi:thiol-disulfide isomerase/thioredoxin|nr:TlpA family protein disulfide reductase [Campylobacteraceae bacterium]MBT3881845.1 TlpA family protein disulfide reductase [Campylobacteraceae bacterium]MBT4179388.1 TlpA family protein disulfide reductase [Campylobacteraceae bacterium]MBT4571813.1 TlpA family protein disulfide reductase [Campylobacteraceae bacterium]MBT4708351.1 TlpA family protein disulfide reductase [Campylobacteraceae bacterium]